MYDIIPDIHGHADKLKALLSHLGYQHSNNAWHHPEKDRRAVFLGDFIDRGADNAGVLRIVRDMMEAGLAVAVMGNHELNAVYYHTPHPATGQPIRRHSDKNNRQHAAFLKEFPLGDPKTRLQIEWMKTLPVFLDLGPFRAVHACWSDEAVAKITPHLQNGVLPGDVLIAAGDEQHPLFDAIETLTKGPEIDLPPGHSFKDKTGHERFKMRMAWWKANAKTWGEIGMSIPDASRLPQGALPDDVSVALYAPDQKPVFFGHYWMSGKPRLQADNALCLDYSAGTNGPLVAYQFDPADPALSAARVTMAP